MDLSLNISTSSDKITKPTVSNINPLNSKAQLITLLFKLILFSAENIIFEEEGNKF